MFSLASLSLRSNFYRKPLFQDEHGVVESKANRGSIVLIVTTNQRAEPIARARKVGRDSSDQTAVNVEIKLAARYPRDLEKFRVGSVDRYAGIDYGLICAARCAHGFDSRVRT